MIQKVKRGMVPAGTEVMIPIMVVHHDARAWGADATELVLRGYELRLSPVCVHAPRVLMVLHPRDSRQLFKEFYLKKKTFQRRLCQKTCLN